MADPNTTIAISLTQDEMELAHLMVAYALGDTIGADYRKGAALLLKIHKSLGWPGWPSMDTIEGGVETHG